MINALLFALTIVILLYFVGLFSTNTIKNGSLVFSDKWQGEIKQISGENIRILQKGEGENILLIHGTPGSIEDWQPIIDNLSKKYRVTAFDRYASGFSTAKNYHYTLDENVQLVNDILEYLDLNSVLVVGHSFGGSITATLATQNNSRISSFIAVGAPLYSSKPDLSYQIGALPIIGKGITFLSSKTIAGSLIQSGLNKSFGTNTHLITTEFLNTRKKIWTQPKVMYATSNIRSNYDKMLKEKCSKYKSISKKISFIVGENDTKTIKEDFFKVKKDLPNAEAIFLKNTAHFVQFEKTDRLIELIEKHMS